MFETKEAHSHKITSLAIDNDQITLASGDVDGNVKLWSLPDMQIRDSID